MSSTSEMICTLLLLTSIANIGNCVLAENHIEDASPPTDQCKFRASSNFASIIRDIYEKQSDLVYVTWKFHMENHDRTGDYSSIYLQEDTDIIDPFTWVLARSDKGLRILSFPFDYGMLSLGTLEPGVKKLASFKIIIPEDQIECFNSTSDNDRLNMLAEFFLSATARISDLSDQDFPTSVCVERHFKRSSPAAEMYLGTHIALQMSSYYSCWSQNQSTLALSQFKIEPQTAWLKSILNLESTWYLCVFVVLNMLTSVFFVYRCRRITKRIEKSDSNLNTFIRCARFLSLIYFLPTVIFILFHYGQYCKRRDIAIKYSSITRSIDILHLFLNVTIIWLPELYRSPRRLFSRRTLLTGFFFFSVFISTCLNFVYTAEVIYFTTLGLTTNPKSFLLVILQAIRSVLFIRALFDLHKFLRFDKRDRTILSFILHRAIHPEFCFFSVLSLLHTILDPYNVSPVTACMFVAAFINGFWYQLEYLSTNDFPSEDYQQLTQEDRARMKLTKLSPEEREGLVHQSTVDGQHFAGAYFDSKGGSLSIDNLDIGLVIPTGALVEETFVYISASKEDYADAIDGLTERNGVLISPIVSCGPPGLQFNKKVKLHMPLYASKSSELDIEASYCQTASHSYQDWTKIEHQDTAMLLDMAVMSIDHFTNFCFFGFGRQPHRRYRASCFGKHEASNYYIHVCLCNDTMQASQDTMAKEERFGYEELVPPKKIVVRKSPRKIDINVMEIKEGWSLRNAELQPFDDIWSKTSDYEEIVLDHAKDDPLPSHVFCTVQIQQQRNATIRLRPRATLPASPSASPASVGVANTAASSSEHIHPDNRTVRSNSSESMSEEILGDIDVDIGKLPRQAFIQIVKFLGNETDVGCDWRRIKTHLGEDLLDIEVVRQFCKGSFMAAKMTLEYYLKKQWDENPQFDPVEGLKQLFEELDLHEPLRYLRRVIAEGASGETGFEDINSNSVFS